MRRVVVTGLGVVSPLGCGVETNWRRLVAGEHGFRRIDTFETSDLACQIAAMIPRGDGSDGTFNADDWFDPKEQRKVDDFIVYGVAAATQALADAGWKADTPEKQESTGVLIGSGIGGLGGIYETSLTLKEKGPRRVSPFFVSGRIINLVAGYVSILHSLKGPNHAVVTACATGTHAVGDAARIIAMGDADVMVAGGAESPVNRIGVAGFAACRALTTGFNDRPADASRPYDRDRDGFVLGEGAGCVVLEEYEHAKARGAKIYAELIGYGMSGDAFHITAPTPDGDGAYRCMKAALKRSGLPVSEIDYVNAHGTSTPLGDEIELKAVERLIGNIEPKLSMSSTKSAIGHLLGGAGAVEAVFTILAMTHNAAPPTRNLDNPSVETAIDLVPKTAREREINVALSNSFGFGGTNASLLFRKLA
ncbi:beta-ketoacyl-ACP synthase II [Methylocystis parvus]|uniref:3-oxoacyl-[acyl-carrier-protein] synthase 2 n=1 Tax=Methylocystis parvus TaxID=134 RepID=A0A6B8M3U1_9HYPH|nr:beta-ketoacyl-ACP synthase II [Methylocystis parvus]QGM97056.1 beta-ketoacyl-ACP synthase II [Methylocystis parvus]WBJ99046.1 beta-ketoacyl-ACP synthase II [Methylocystis parvus OBBP]